jgi:hypothetical protein
VPSDPQRQHQPRPPPREPRCRRVPERVTVNCGLGLVDRHDPAHEQQGQESAGPTRDVNHRTVAEYGLVSDPRAVTLDSDLHDPDRGLLEFIESIKLDVAIWYVLPGATQKRSTEPMWIAQTSIDEVINGNTNEPEHKYPSSDEVTWLFGHPADQLPCLFVSKCESTTLMCPFYPRVAYIKRVIGVPATMPLQCPHDAPGESGPRTARGQPGRRVASR